MRKRDYGRKVMAKALDRPLNSDELVHHKDNDHNNHEFNNLQVVTRSEHIKIHKPNKGYKFNEKQRARLSEAHKGLKPSLATRQNISVTQKKRKITWGDKIAESKTKVQHEDVLTILKEYPLASYKEIMHLLNIKSYSPLFKLGGIKKLRVEVQS